MLEISPSLSQFEAFYAISGEDIVMALIKFGAKSPICVFIGHCVPWLQSSPDKRILCHLPFAMYCWRLTLRLLNFQKVKTFKKVWTLNAHTCVWFLAIQWLFRSTRRKLSTLSSNSPADWFPSQHTFQARIQFRTTMVVLNEASESTAGSESNLDVSSITTDHASFCRPSAAPALLNALATDMSSEQLRPLMRLDVDVNSWTNKFMTQLNRLSVTPKAGSEYLGHRGKCEIVQTL